MKLLEKTSYLCFVFVPAFFFGGCMTSFKHKTIEPYSQDVLLPPSDQWQDSSEENQVDLLANITDCQLILEVEERTKKNQYLEEVTVFSFIVTGRGLNVDRKCSYYFGHHFWDSNAKIDDGSISLIQDSFDYQISQSDYQALIDEINKIKTIHYQRPDIDNEESYARLHLYIFSRSQLSGQFESQELSFGSVDMPKEIYPLYNFIRERLVVHYISKMESNRTTWHRGNPIKPPSKTRIPFHIQK